MGIWHHTTDEVGLSLVEDGHQAVELSLEVGGDRLAALPFLPGFVWIRLERLAWMVLEAFNCKGIGALLDHLNLSG